MGIWNKHDDILMSIHGRKPDGSPRVCQVCGNEPDAIWACKESITICRGCALVVLPALLVDAFFMQNSRGPAGIKIKQAFRNLWTKAEARFWQSVAHQLAFLGKEKKPASFGAPDPLRQSPDGEEK